MPSEVRWNLRVDKNTGIARAEVFSVDKPRSAFLRNDREYYHKYRQELAALGKVKRLEIYINSVGGSVACAAGMMKAILDSNIPTRVLITGNCHSAAVIVAFASGAEKVCITPSGSIYVHNAKPMWSSGHQWQDRLGTKSSNFLIRKAIQIQSGQKKKKVQAWMDASTRFSAGEALSEGLVDDIIMRYDFEKMD